MTEYLTIPTLLKARFRMVENADSARHMQRHKAFGGTSALRDELLSSSRLSDELTRFLVEMDRKLDIILSFVEQENMLDDFPLEGKAVQLSGAGVVLETKENLSPGDHLELLLILEELPMRMVSVIAVVHEALSAPVISGPRNIPYQAFFATLGEDDREDIIQYVFQEDRRHIRMQKNDAE